MPPLTSKTDGRSPLRIHLAGGEDSNRSEVKSLLDSLDDPTVEVSEGLPAHSAGNNDGPAEIVAIVIDSHEQNSLEEIQRLAAQSPPPVLLALVKERSSALMRRALRAGADDVLFLPLDRSDITRALLKVTENSRREEHDEAGGRICSFISLTGGVGVTTLSGSLALALSYTHKKRVGLVDLDLQNGGLAVFLDLEPERTIALLTDQRGAIDSIQLESALTRHDSGIYLLAAPRRIEESEAVSEGTVTAVLDVMRQLFDFVVVDCGSHINENVAAAWERSDEIFYVIEQSIAAARSAVRFLDLFGRLNIEIQPAFVLNRFDSRHPMNEDLIGRTLARPLEARVARDDKAFERSQLNGHDPWQTVSASALMRSIEEMAQKVAAHGQPPDDKPERRGLVGRLLTAIGARG